VPFVPDKQQPSGRFVPDSPFVGPTLFQARTNPADYAPTSPAMSGAAREPMPVLGGATKAAYERSLAQLRGYKDPKGMLTTGGEFQDFAAGMGKAATDLWLGAKQMFGGASFEDAANKRQTDAPLMATPSGRAGQFAGNVAVAAPAAFVPGANTFVGGTIIGGLLGALQPTEQSGERAINTAVGAAVGGTANYAMNRLLNPRQAPTRAPSIDEIKLAKDAAYNAADASPDVVPLSRIGDVIPKVEKMLRDEGFRPALHPSAKESLSALYEEATQPGVYGQTLKGVEGLRRQLMQAQLAATNRADAMMAGRVLDEFDDVLDELVPYGEARSLYHTLRKAQDIEALFEKARNAAGGYTQSGFENTLRIQFRQLADNAKRFNRFNAAEKEAILKVVRGGPVQSVVRFLGKFAARGPVSAMATGMLGNAIGGPAGAAALGAVGEGAKFAAGQARTAAAENVSEIIRSGALRSVPAGAGTAARVPVAPATNALVAPTVNYLSEERQRRRNALAR
jgi:hypothetical protein